MCGINGYIGNASRSREIIQRMNERIAHRGPDHQSVFINDKVALGHVRLSIIDLSEGAHQPMHDPSGRYTIIFNGEIYNYAELKEEMKDVSFRTNSDTEVLLHLFIREKEDCLHKLRGMFAFAVWDEQEQSLFMARDRFGKKPIYYHHAADHFLFSSELRSVLHSGLIKKEIELQNLREFIRYQTVHAPRTLVKDVFMLKAGHYAWFKNGTFTDVQYYHLPVKPTVQQVTKNEASEHVKELFASSIKDRLVADVEVGAFLSGGIDSSATVAMMSQVAHRSISTFTVTFDESEYSEARYAEQVAKKYHTNHHEIKLKPEEMLHLLPEALQAMDHPGGDGPNTYVVSKKTREQGIKVVLTGLGGDELFAGYPVFQHALALQRRKMLLQSPAFVKRSVAWFLGLKDKSVGTEKIREMLRAPGALWPNFYAVSRSLFPSPFLHDLILHDDRKNPIWDLANDTWHHADDHHGLLSWISHNEISTYMQSVLLRDTDVMTMAHGLEARAPFLDHRLVEYVLSLPDAVKVPVTPKALFTEAMGDLLPPEIVHRPKMGFTLPWDVWMKTELRTFCESRMQSLAERGWFDRTLLLGLWERFLKGDQTVNWARVWIFIVLEDWSQRNLDA